MLWNRSKGGGGGGGVEGSDREVTWSRWEKTDTRRKDLVEKSGSMSGTHRLAR